MDKLILVRVGSVQDTVYTFYHSCRYIVSTSSLAMVKRCSEVVHLVISA